MLTSIYTDHVDALPPSQRDRPEHCEVAVIGGGLTGVTAALHLAEHGYDVVLLEAETVGSGARTKWCGLWRWLERNARWWAPRRSA